MPRAARDLRYHPIVINTNGSLITRNLRKPAWRTAVLREWQAHPVTRLPFERAGRVPEPPPEAARGTERALERRARRDPPE